jgi:flagellar M-ring protein FliF
MDFLKNILGKGKERFQQLSGSQRGILLALVGAGILAGIFLIFLSGHTDYGVLFTNLSQEDAGAIVTKLKEKKVPYQVESGGTAILVPKTEMFELRLLLASEGLPRGGGVGFEIFDRQDLGVTDFVQRLNYQRALQGELARTIAGMPEILEARVHVVSPKESLFLEDQKKPSASVAVKLRPGRVLSPAQVEGIVNLVASAVAGLHPSQVTVVDLNGRILSKPQDPASITGLSTRQIDLQRQVEESYERKLQELLDKMLGPRKSFVRVSTELDFQKIDLREETFTPNRDLVRSEQKVSERSTRPVEGGNPESGIDLSRGTVTPPPPGKGPPPLTAPAAPAKPGASGSERYTELRNYEINKVVRQVVDTPGKIKRLSLAVVVDGIYKGKGNTFTPRDAEEMRQLANLAKKAVGFNPERGDQLEVSCAPLAAQAVEGVAASGAEGGWSDSLGISWKVGLLVLVVLGLLMFLMKKRRITARPPLLEAPPPHSLPASGDNIELLPEGRPATSLPAEAPSPLLPEPVGGKEKVSQLITAYPDRAVEVLRLWLHEKDAR